ncbi:MAG: hypothetical protein KAG91_00495 [Mycoplasmataceae bacterium]|nr:hypothetical protein [Mycoplasmataceae bacterium]
MTKKEKFIYLIISIITLGIYPIIINKKTTKETNGDLSEAKKITVDVTKLIENLGGKENIVVVEYTHTKLKIFTRASSAVNVELINGQKGITGVVASSKAITLIVGNQAKQLSTMI